MIILPINNKWKCPQSISLVTRWRALKEQRNVVKMARSHLPVDYLWRLTRVGNGALQAQLSLIKKLRQINYQMRRRAAELRAFLSPNSAENCKLHASRSTQKSFACRSWIYSSKNASQKLCEEDEDKEDNDEDVKKVSQKFQFLQWSFWYYCINPPREFHLCPVQFGPNWHQSNGQKCPSLSTCPRNK